MCGGDTFVSTDRFSIYGTPYFKEYAFIALKLTIDPRDHFKIIAGLVPATHPNPKYT